MNDADFELLNKQINNASSERTHIVWLEDKIRTLMTEIRALESDVERLSIDTHYLRQENERLRRQRPEEQR